ncbi:MAG: pyrroline-5-carboxylate reductase [Dehalococcoidia bacterium]|nr:pyrroline-5-carboxylate reductase [Dehalococcoidia bacterium]
MNLGIIGGGAMGEAIIASVIRNQVAEPTAIKVYDVATLRLHYLRQTYAVETAADAAEAVHDAGLVLLAVKPQEFEKAARAIGSIGDATAVSIMAGVPIARIGKLLGTPSVVRAMPNTPAQIGEGMTVWTATYDVDETARAAARSIFAALGEEAFVPDEKYLDMATALSGSGPAYVFLFIEALVDAGVHIGLSRDLASTMALQTVLGSARYAEETGKHPGELRNQVTSPGGTTAAALRALEAGGFRADILEAVIAAYERSRALGEGEAK